jgi:hypothetical protein
VKSVPLVVLVLVGIAFVPAFIHERTLRKHLQIEVESLRAQVAQIESLRQENQRLQQSRIDADDLERLRKQDLELARLRGEVSRLRNEPEMISRASAPMPGQSVLITSKEGQQIVGDQLQQFKLEADGALTSTNDSWIGLNNTIGKNFRLSGEVWLAGPSTTMDYPEDTPDGFAVYLREWDGMHRYAATTRSMLVKRRNWSVGKAQGISEVTRFQEPPLQTWIPFTVEATSEQIVFRVGNQGATIPGPLDEDGANKIAVAPGTKIRNVSVQLLP